VADHHCRNQAAVLDTDEHGGCRSVEGAPQICARVVRWTGESGGSHNATTSLNHSGETDSIFIKQ
jgi:hypothetical protein